MGDFAHIPNKHMMTINFDTITNNFEVIYVIKTVMKYHLKKIDTSFHQPLPNMVQRLFADVITKFQQNCSFYGPNYRYNYSVHDPIYGQTLFPDDLQYLNN
jgi:hypothetical protein